jgi:hypothetical protein
MYVGRYTRVRCTYDKLSQWYTEKKFNKTEVPLWNLCASILFPFRVSHTHTVSERETYITGGSSDARQRRDRNHDRKAFRSDSPWFIFLTAEQNVSCAAKSVPSYPDNTYCETGSGWKLSYRVGCWRGNGLQFLPSNCSAVTHVLVTLRGSQWRREVYFPMKQLRVSSTYPIKITKFYWNKKVQTK